MDSFQWLALLFSYLVAIIIGLIGLIVVWKMWKGDIDLSKWCRRASRAAATRASALPVLDLHFVISMSFLLMVVASIKTAKEGTFSFPDLKNVWSLLGISGGSYVVSKGIERATRTAATGSAGWGAVIVRNK